MQKYEVDNKKQANWNTPPNKRGNIHLSWIYALVSPLNTLNTLFSKTYFPDVLSRSKRTAQKIVLEDTLNKVFNDVGFPLIYINNTGLLVDVVYFHRLSENKPTYIKSLSENEPLYLYNESEYFNGGEFVVYVPLSVISNFNVNQISSEVNKYKPAGTKFKIQTY